MEVRKWEGSLGGMCTLHRLSQHAFLMLPVHPHGESDKTCPHRHMYAGFMHIHAQVLWHTHKYVHRPLTGSVHIEKLGDMCAGLACQYWLTQQSSALSLPFLYRHTHWHMLSLQYDWSLYLESH